MNEEIWMPAKNCEGYFVSSFGRIRSEKKSKAKEIKPFIQNRGYLQVGISCNGKKINKTLHSIIAETFIGPRNGFEINHKDGDKSNNRVDNLEYATRSQNMRHAVENKLHVTGHRKLTQRDVDFIRSDKTKTNKPESYYAQLFGVNKSNINHIMRKRTWK